MTNARRMRDDPRLIVETFFIRRLVHIGAATLTEIYAGDTTYTVRCDRIRKIILAWNLRDEPCGKRADGTAESFQIAFERLFATSLDKPVIGELPHVQNQRSV